MASTDYGLQLCLVSDVSAGRNTEQQRLWDEVRQAGHTVTEYDTADWGSITFTNFDVLCIGLDPSDEVTAANIVTANLPTILMPSITGDLNASSVQWPTELDLTGTWEFNRQPSGGNTAKISDGTHWITTHFTTNDALNHGTSYSTFSYPGALTSGESYIGTKLVEQNGAWETGGGCMFAIESGTAKLTSGTTWARIVIFYQAFAASYNGAPTDETRTLLARAVEWVGGRDTGDTWDYDFGAAATNDDFDGQTGGAAPSGWTRQGGDDQWRVENTVDSWSWGLSDSRVNASENITTTGLYTFDAAANDTSNDMYFYGEFSSTANDWVTMCAYGTTGYGLEYRLTATVQSLKLYEVAGVTGGSQIGSTVDLGSVEGDTNWYRLKSRFWLRFQAIDGGSNTALKGKMWWGSKDDEPVAWDIEETSTYGFGTNRRPGVRMVENLTNNMSMLLFSTDGLTTNDPPSTPTVTVDSYTSAAVTLSGSTYSDPNADAHADTQWQVATDSGFSSVVIDKTVGSASEGPYDSNGDGFLAPSTLHYARVRYSDGTDWSSWSTGVSFTTAAGTAPDTPTVWVDTLTDTAIVIKTSAYSTSGTSVHAGTQWQIDDTSAAFGSVIYDLETGKSTRLRETLVTAGLTPGNTYYARARHIAKDGLASGWGVTGAIIIPATSASAPDTPTLSEGTNTSTSVILTGTAYNDTDGDAHVSSDWVVATDSGFVNTIIESTGDTTNLVSYTATGLTPAVTYYAHVRYRDSSGAYSLWSNTLTFAPDAADLVEVWEDWRITDPRAMRPIRGASNNVTVSVTPAGAETWELDYSQDYGVTWTDIAAAATVGTATHAWDTSGFTADDEGTILLRARIYDGTSVYSDWAYSTCFWDPNDRETAGTSLWNDSDDKRVAAGAPFDLTDWTDLGLDAGAGSWLGDWSTGHITHHVTFSSSEDHDTLALTAIGAKSPTTVEAAVEVMHTHDGGGFPWMEYWDIENSYAGLALMASGSSPATKNGIFVTFGSITYDAYGITYDEGAGLVDFWVECWQDGVRVANYVRGPTLSAASQMGTCSAVVYDLAGTTNDLKPRYEVHALVTTTAVYSDGTRDLRIRAALRGRGVDEPDTSGWHIDYTWEGADIPDGYFGYTGSHDSLSSATGVGFRSFSEFSLSIPTTAAVEPPGSSGDPTQDYTEQAGLCPDPDNEKIRYLDRRVSLDTTGVSAAYDAGTNTTTWTLPYTVAVDGSEGTMAIAREDTLAWYTADRPATNQVAVSGYGDLTLTAVFIGILYCFQYDPLRPYVQTEGGTDDRGRLTINYIDFRYHETTDLTATATVGLDRGAVVKTVDLSAQADGVLRVPIMARNERVSLSLTNCTPGGCRISSMEWEGKLTQRSRRI